MSEQLAYSRRREGFHLRSGIEIPDQVYETEIELPHEVAVTIDVGSVFSALRQCARHNQVRAEGGDGYGNPRQSAADFRWGIDGVDFEPGESITQSGCLSVDLDLKPFFAVTLWGVNVEGDWETQWPELESILRHWSGPRGLRLLRLTAKSLGSYFVWQVDFRVVQRGLTVGDIDRFVDDVEVLASAVDRRDLTAESMRALVRDGRGSILVGLAENSSLEAKREMQLGTKAVEIELAKDVASFANTGGSGLIVIGLATKSRRGYDEISRVHHVDSRLTASAIRRAVDRNTFPRVEGLEVRRVAAEPDGAAELMYIFVPPQPRSLLPLLVAGTVIQGKVEAIYAGIPTRRDDETAMMSVQELHSILRVGVALYEEDRPVLHLRRADGPAQHLA